MNFSNGWLKNSFAKLMICVRELQGRGDFQIYSNSQIQTSVTQLLDDLETYLPQNDFVLAQLKEKRWSRQPMNIVVTLWPNIGYSIMQSLKKKY